MEEREFEKDPDIRFGWYLRPSYAMCRAQAEMHDLLRRQYGLVTGGAFMPTEGAMEGFHAHLTLAMADLPPVLHREVLEFVREAGPIGPEQFTAEYFHLFAFRSETWGGAWWPTLTWKLLYSWRLGCPDVGLST
jgi:hypothetical protein